MTRTRKTVHYCADGRDRTRALCGRIVAWSSNLYSLVTCRRCLDAVSR